MGGNSFSLNGSIYIRPDSVCYFRATMLIELMRGVIYKDSFAVLDRSKKICYTGSNDYLSRMTGFPIHPEILFMLFTGDRCENVFGEKFGFRTTAERDNRIIMRRQNLNFLEFEINDNDRTTKSITATNRQQSQVSFKTLYSQYRQYTHFLLPTVFNITAQEGRNSIKINAVFQDMAFDQPQTINFSIPDSYKIVELK